MSFFEKIIKSITGGHVKLVSTDKTTHMNIVVSSTDDDWSRSALTLTVGRALELRDALNEAYPPVQAQPEPSEYKVGDAITPYGTHRVYRDVPNTGFFQKTIASGLTLDNAKKIAQALNEAEGL